MKQIISQFGEIKIHKDLVSQVVEAATLSVEGVASLAVTPQKHLSKILSYLKIKGIKVDMSKDLNIEVPIIVKYGYSIPAVAARVQQEILKSLSQTLNVETAYITVKVRGLEA